MNFNFYDLSRLFSQGSRFIMIYFVNFHRTRPRRLSKIFTKFSSFWWITKFVATHWVTWFHKSCLNDDSLQGQDIRDRDLGRDIHIRWGLKWNTLRNKSFLTKNNSTCFQSSRKHQIDSTNYICWPLYYQNVFVVTSPSLKSGFT